MFGMKKKKRKEHLCGPESFHFLLWDIYVIKGLKNVFLFKFMCSELKVMSVKKHAPNTNMATTDLMLKQEEQRGCNPASRDIFKVCLVTELYIYLIHFLALC